MMSKSHSVPALLATVILSLCGAYFFILALYILLSPLLPASFGSALGMSNEYFPIAVNLGSSTYGIGLVVLCLPVIAISLAFFADAWFLWKGSKVALSIAIAFFLLPLLGLVFSPISFFSAGSAGQIFTLLMRLVFLGLGFSLIVLTLHEHKHGK